ncbi:MAG: prolipoprotein diacylglyceryl transferase [Clostridiales bacterium]|nr:prolipoprotein diacylglyceryl transferase [Clostridiales bacterium]
MADGARFVNILGISLYAYGLMVMLGCVLAVALGIRLTRARDQERFAAALTAVIGIPLGFITARLMYALLDPNFQPLITLRNVLDISSGGFSMFGALIGAVLSTLIAAKFAGVPRARMLDLLSPALLLFLVPARLGEGYTALGISRPLTTEWIANSFLARQDEFDAYLRTYLLEAVIAAALLIIILRYLHQHPRDGKPFKLFCLLYGISQTLMESLRYDGHMRYSFIGVQQVLAVTLFGVTLIALAVPLLRQSRKKLLPILGLLAIPFSVLAGVGVEFLIDRSEMGKLLSYSLFLLVLAVPTVLGILMLKQEEAHG